VIDLRSDTLTRPSAGMRRAMAEAEVGDDVYGEDPTVIALEERIAGIFGKEAALFAPTGSMANVLAVAALVGPGQEVLCESRAHILRAELGAHGALTGLTSRTWADPDGQIDLEAIESLYAPDMGPFFVRTAAVSVENTHNFAGGSVIPLADFQALRAWTHEHGCAVHMDGARIWNAHVQTGTSLRDYGAVADVLAVCLSKGLGAPIGSLVVGSREVIDASRVRRKRMGGGMRQVGVLAAAGMYALDHKNARLIAEICGLDPASVPTNIVVVDVPSAPEVVGAAAEQGVRIGAVGPRRVRLLTHLDISRAEAEQAGKVLASVIGD
jgi:threonine aldolase